MAAVAVSDHGTTVPGYPAVFCRAEGDVTASLFDPPDTLLWAVVATLGDGATLSWSEGNGSKIPARMFAGSSCPTGRLHLTEVACDGPLAPLSHMHSHDELIYVLDGTLRNGRTAAPAGSTMFVPGGTRYSLRSKEAVA